MAELRDLAISARVVIPVALLSARYSRSGGPGGQHVNRTESKVDIRLDLTRCVEAIGEARVAKIRAELANRLDGDGNLQVVSSEHRSRAMNMEAALARMEGWIRTALAPKKVRRKTKPTRGSKERRLDAKKRRSDVKKQRRSNDY